EGVPCVFGTVDQEVHCSRRWLLAVGCWPKRRHGQRPTANGQRTTILECFAHSPLLSFCSPSPHPPRRPKPSRRRRSPILSPCSCRRSPRAASRKSRSRRPPPAC